MGNEFDRLLVASIATPNELEKCDDLIPVRYNGKPGEPVTPDQLYARGADYRWFGKRKTSSGAWETFPAYPVQVKPDGRAAVPNCPENIAILESFKPQRHMIRIETTHGHKNVPTGQPHPPLYERIRSGFGGISMDGLSEADREDIAKRMLKMLDKDTAPSVASVDAPPADAAARVSAQNRVDALRTELNAALVLKDEESVSESIRKDAAKNVGKLTKELEKAEAELKNLGG